MQFTARTIHALLLMSILALGACDEDGGTAPTPGAPWEELSLPSPIEDGIVLAMASAAGRTVGLVQGASGPYLLEQSTDDWTTTDLGLGTSILLRDLALDSQGRGILVGAKLPGTLQVWAERPDWTEVTVTGSGALMAVTVDVDVFYATGLGSPSAPFATGTVEGNWTTGTIPTPGDPQEKGIVAVTSDRTGRYACGWDDGADGSPEQPDDLVLHDDGTGWKVLSPPSCDCLNREFTAIAANGEGNVFVGGVIHDFSMDAVDEAVAFLLRYDSPAQTWTEISLPHAGLLDRVNDILIMSDQDVILACGEGKGAIALVPALGTSAIEWRDEDIEVYSLVERDDGTMLASGANVTGTKPRPVVLQRRAP